MTENFGNTGDMAQEHGDQVAAGVDKAGNMIDEKTGGQYSEQIQQGEDAVASRLGGEDSASEPGAGSGGEATQSPTGSSTGSATEGRQ
jgi:hypothetical protein